MKKLIKKIILNRFIAKKIQKIILNVHTQAYNFSAILAISVNNGIHPKHRIMRYKEWFVDNIQKEWTVLDVGCNTGIMPDVMSQKAIFVYGIEIEKQYIKEAKSKRQKDNIVFICADATTYDYSSLQASDCITLSNVLEHIEHRVDFLKKLIRQVKWKDKKRLLIRVPMIDREWIAVYKKELCLDYKLDSTHFTEYTYEQLKGELKNSRVEILSHHIKFGEIYAVCEAR